MYFVCVRSYIVDVVLLFFRFHIYK